MARRRMDWTGAALFVGLAYGLSWGWLFAVPRLGLPLWTGVFAALGPGAAAILVRGPLLGEGFAQSGIGLATPPGRGWTYILAFAGPPVIVIITAALIVATGNARFIPGAVHDPWRGQDVFFVQAAAHGPAGLLSIFILAPLVPVFAFGEELGWRGYLFPKLMPLGAPIAIFGSGAVWALWHLPNVFYGNTGLPAFVIFALGTTGAGAFLCWLRLRARSVWPAAVFHSAYDYQGPAVAGLLTPAALQVDQLTIGLLVAVLVCELLLVSYLFAFGGMLRALREDRVVWSEQRIGQAVRRP